MVERFNHPMVKVKVVNTQKKYAEEMVSTTLWWKLKELGIKNIDKMKKFQPPYGES